METPTDIFDELSQVTIPSATKISIPNPSEEEIPEEDQTTELNEDDTLLAPENAVSDIEDPAETATDIEEESDESEVDETDLIDTDISEPEIGNNQVNLNLTLQNLIVALRLYLEEQILLLQQELDQLGPDYWMKVLGNLGISFMAWWRDYLGNVGDKINITIPLDNKHFILAVHATRIVSSLIEEIHSYNETLQKNLFVSDTVPNALDQLPADADLSTTVKYIQTTVETNWSDFQWENLIAQSIKNANPRELPNYRSPQMRVAALGDWFATHRELIAQLRAKLIRIKSKMPVLDTQLNNQLNMLDALLLQLKVWANKPIIAMYLTTRTEINSEKFSDILTYLQNDIPQYYLNVSENERAEFEDKYPVISPEFQEALKDRLFPPLHTPFELQKTPEDLLHQIILAIANTRIALK